MTMIPTTPLSEKLSDMAMQMSQLIEGGAAITLTHDQAGDLVHFLSCRATDARALERMLERRLKASEVPGAPAAPLPPVRPLPPEVEPRDDNLVQLRPRAGARVIPFTQNGGAA